MKKIALIIPGCDDSWIGGLNYYCNLLTQCHLYAADKVDITVIVNSECAYKIQKMMPPEIAVLTTSLVKRYSLPWIMSNFVYLATGRDFLMERFLIRNNIELLTHSPCRNYGKRIKLIGWIPDIQHKYLPHLFSSKEQDKRDQDFQNILTHCERIILSSQAALEDVLRFYHVSKQKLVVLPFYKQTDTPDSEITKEDLQKKYHILGDFLFLPNQFWAHKNHSVVIEALNLLISKNKQVVVVCSGNTCDYRNPDYFKELMKRVENLKLHDNFKVLGLIPMADVNALARHSMALINPSLFEGWSSTVEEARANGKHIILSDIPVHQEQSPPDALFFKPDSADELAKCIISVINSYTPYREELRKKNAQINAVKLCTSFAQQYAKIVQSIE